METKPLLFGLIGFIVGGLVVSIAATDLDKTNTKPANSEVAMSEMTESLKNLKGDTYDKMFISSMIEHHQAAVEMARLSAERASHSEIKDLSLAIITTQQEEITTMKQWRAAWGYGASTNHTPGH